MNRNTESRFSQIPQINISRSKFSRNHTHKTTFNAGKLVPIYVDEMLPGDTFTMDTSFFVRMSTPIYPVMDNAYFDYYFFFVPNRLLWDHWKQFMGENTSAPWTQITEYTIPQVKIEGGSNLPDWKPKSVADYMGLPTLTNTTAEGAATYSEKPNISVSALPFRAYVLIWNEWFRSENYQYPAYFTTNDTDRTLTNGQDTIDGGRLLPVDRFHDYFSSALPEPQKGDPVTIPIGETAKLVGGDIYPFKSVTGGPDTVRMGSEMMNEGSTYNMVSFEDSSGLFSYLYNGSPGTPTVANPLNRLNLYADLKNSTSVTINALRQAFQIQRLLELDARGGTRYISLLKAHFGVTSPDSRQQRPEYLGGSRFAINMQQVLQTSSTDTTSPQGNTAAFSATSHVSSDFTYSATEHGWIIGVACIRTDHTYQQGINKMWSRKGRYDFYWPALAHIGEQAILNKEIFAYCDDFKMDEPFGYQEAWAEYRYKPSYVSGAMRSLQIGTGSLDAWHYADYYTELPTLSETWLKEPQENVDRTLAVQSTVEDQFICDIAFKLDCVRPMPVYSVPGLIDHI